MPGRPSQKMSQQRMPTWTKAPEALVARFATVMKALPAAEVRKMFGYPAGFVNGHLFAGVFGEEMFLRLSADDCARFIQLVGARPFEPVRGRVMRDYVVVPKPLLTSSTRMREWLGRAFAHAKALPPKGGTARGRPGHPGRAKR